MNSSFVNKEYISILDDYVSSGYSVDDASEEEVEYITKLIEEQGRKVKSILKQKSRKRI